MCIVYVSYIIKENKEKLIYACMIMSKAKTEKLFVIFFIKSKTVLIHKIKTTVSSISINMNYYNKANPV